MKTKIVVADESQTMVCLDIGKNPCSPAAQASIDVILHLLDRLSAAVGAAESVVHLFSSNSKSRAGVNFAQKRTKVLEVARIHLMGVSVDMKRGQVVCFDCCRLNQGFYEAWTKHTLLMIADTHPVLNFPAYHESKNDNTQVHCHMAGVEMGDQRARRQRAL